MSVERLPSSRGCFVCGKNNPIGLRVEFVQTPQGATTLVNPGKDFEGFGGVLQGGIAAGLLDDAMWYAIFGLTGTVTMTAELTVRYKAPVPVETALTVNGELVAQRRSLYLCNARITLADGTLLAEATGKFLPAPSALAEQLLQEMD